MAQVREGCQSEATYGRAEAGRSTGTWAPWWLALYLGWATGPKGDYIDTIAPLTA